jgi:uncharacterized membrane protein
MQMIGKLRSTFLKGLAAVLPLSMTIYLVYWLGTSAESFLGDGLRLLLPDHWYRPGMGIVVGFIVVLIAGLLVNAYVVRRAMRFGEKLLARIPLVKTIFGALRDFTRFLPSGNDRKDLQRVVIWRMGNARLVGFVTSETVHPRLCGEESDRFVAVYFPLSYQLGGHTLFLPRDELHTSELTVEEALRLVLIGGITSGKPQLSDAEASNANADSNRRERT